MKIFKLVSRRGASLTPDRALCLAQAAFGEGRLHDAERLVIIAQAKLDGVLGEPDGTTVLRVNEADDQRR